MYEDFASRRNLARWDMVMLMLMLIRYGRVQ